MFFWQKEENWQNHDKYRKAEEKPNEGIIL